MLGLQHWERFPIYWVFVVQPNPVESYKKTNHVNGQIQSSGPVVFVLCAGAGAAHQTGIHHLGNGGLGIAGQLFQQKRQLRLQIADALTHAFAKSCWFCLRDQYVH